jgi:D-inositol-3-phosphate glycosyltransferase
MDRPRRPPIVTSSLSIFHPRGELGLGKNPFGKDVANLELFRALAQHGGFEQLDILSIVRVSQEHLQEALIGKSGSATRVVPGSGLDQAAPKAAGALLRGQPDLQNLAWLRRYTVGDRAYSLLGLVHTIAPAIMRQTIAMAMVAPVHPWDAIICTSPSIRDALTTLFDAWGEFLGERTGGTSPPRPWRNAASLRSPPTTCWCFGWAGCRSSRRPSRNRCSRPFSAPRRRAE